MSSRWIPLALAASLALLPARALAVKPVPPPPTITAMLLGGAGGAPAIFTAVSDGRILMAQYNAWDYPGAQPFQQVAQLPGRPVSMEWLSWGVMVCLENGDIYRSDSSLPITFTLVENVFATAGPSGSFVGPPPTSLTPPFSPDRIEYESPRSGPVEVRVFDVQGRLVWSTRSEHGTAGRYSVTWGAKDVAAGVYFSRIQLPDGSVTSNRVVVAR